MPFTTRGLESLLAEARGLNRSSGVTGVLLFSDGNFMQLFEGESDAVDETYTRIRSSTRHRGLIQLFDRPIEHRSFPDWEMGFARPTNSEMLRLSTARWEAMRDEAGRTLPKPDGLSFLEHFWELNKN